MRKSKYVQTPKSAKKPIARMSTALASRTLMDRRNSSTARTFSSHRSDAQMSPATDRAWAFELDNNASTFLPLVSQLKKFRDAIPVENSTVRSPIDVQQGMYLALHELVSAMSHLPEGHVLSAASDSVDHASEILAQMSQFSGPAPKVFAHGGDAVVLTWDMEKVTRYLTVIGEDANFQEINKSTLKAVEQDVSFESPSDRFHWLKILGGLPLAVSTI